MTQADPYAVRPGEVRAPPVRLRERVRFLGPSVVVGGAVVGSGELLLTSSLGAQAGIVLLWWVLLSCWSKSIVQAELGRYVLASGDTYLRALGRLPGRIPGPRGPVAWPIWLLVAPYPIAVLALGGIVGGTGQALSLIVPKLDSAVAAGLVAAVAMAILAVGTYASFERIMWALVATFTLATLVCAVAMQFTEFGVTAADLARGFSFDFPVEHFALALGVYGITGINAGENAAYTYWCIEKGYPSFIGSDREDPEWLGRARSWIKVLHVDVWLTLILLTFATLPFFVLGAGVLHELGEEPAGRETISILSNMFTKTLGTWAVWVFGAGAFLILFSTVVSGIGAGARILPEYIIELGFLERSNLKTRFAITRGYLLAVPVVSFALYLAIERPVFMATVTGVVAAAMLPIQSGATLWLQARHMDSRVSPGLALRTALWGVFLFQVVMSYLVVRYVVF